MKNTSNLFKEYFNLPLGTTLADKPLNEMTVPLNDAIFPLYAGDKILEYKIVIGAQVYLDTNIYSVKIDNLLSEDNKFSIGNAVAQKVIISLKIGTETIPKMANVKVYARYNGTLGPTEWVEYGSFFIDERTKKNNKLILTCYDSMLKAEKPFIQSDQVDNYPMLQTKALNTICSRIGVALDSTGINTAYTIDYPNERTMRELLMDIACSNGGNFIIINDTLKLIKPSNSAGEVFNYAGFEEINDTLQFSRVTMYYTDEDYFTVGDDTKDELIVRNDNATQAICNGVLSQLSTYVHRPYKLKSAYLNPIYELGDLIQVNNVNYQIWSYALSFTGAGIRYSNIKSPGESAIEHEYPYEGQYSRAIKQRIQEGKAYFGTTISRKNGLHIEKTDGSSEATFNSEKLEFCAKVNGTMKPVLFFDSLAQKFKMTSDIDIESVTQLNTKIENNYSTTTQMNSAISTNAENLTITFNKSISTAKTETINSANSSTDNKLQNYSTTTQMNSAINFSANSLTSTFNQSITTTNNNVTTITNNVSTLTQTVSGFETRVTTAEGNASSAIQKANSIALSVNNTKVTIDDIDGVTIKNGGFKIINTNNVNVFSVDNSGNVTLAGNLYNTASNKTVRLYNGKLEIGSGNSAGGYNSWMQTITGTIYGAYYRLAPLPSEESLIIEGSKSVYIKSSWYTTIGWGMGSAGHVFDGRVQLNSDIYMSTPTGMRAFKPIESSAIGQYDYVLGAKR